MSGSAGSEPVKGLSQAQLVRKRFFGHTAAIIAMGVFGAILVLVFSSIGWGPIPGWWKHNYTETFPIVNGGKPTMTGPFSWGDHPFGQDRVGHDMFAMVMRGAQQSFFVMVLVGAIAGGIGIVVGALSGYFRGMTEAVLMRFGDALTITPLIIIAAIFGKMSDRITGGGSNVLFFCILIGALIWFGMARLVRAEFLSLREREFVDAARIAGASDRRIVFHHILPNAVGVIIVNITLLMAEAVLLEAALSYLGVGIQPPDVSLGRLIVDNKEALSTRPYLFLWPGLFIVLMCLCVNFIGDGLRDAFDPRQKKFNGRKAQLVDHPELDDLDRIPAIIRPRNGNAAPAAVSAHQPGPGVMTAPAPAGGQPAAAGAPAGTAGQPNTAPATQAHPPPTGPPQGAPTVGQPQQPPAGGAPQAMAGQPGQPPAGGLPNAGTPQGYTPQAGSASMQTASVPVTPGQAPSAKPQVMPPSAGNPAQQAQPGQAGAPAPSTDPSASLYEGAPASQGSQTVAQPQAPAGQPAPSGQPGTYSGHPPAPHHQPVHPAPTSAGHPLSKRRPADPLRDQQYPHSDPTTEQGKR